MDPGLDALRLGDDAIPPVREGLPPRYRMRADSHYVEQLDSSLLNSPIRFLEVHGLESPTQNDDEGPSSAFIESIRRHGVLQPLLVRTRGGRHIVIAGRKRLAAAAAAGLSRVPCLIERVDDDQAPILAAATNTPATDTLVARVEAPAPVPSTDLTFAAFADCLTAVASSAHLLAPGSTLIQTVAVDLVRAEAARALQLLVAARVLRGEVSVARRDRGRASPPRFDVGRTVAQSWRDSVRRRGTAHGVAERDHSRADRALRNQPLEGRLSTGQFTGRRHRRVVGCSRWRRAASLLAFEAGRTRMARCVGHGQQRIDCRSGASASCAACRGAARGPRDARLFGGQDEPVDRASCWSLVNSQLPIPNSQPLPTPNWEFLGVGNWALGVVGNWILVVGS
jgi:ParB/Sulfiredoxin domain